MSLPRRLALLAWARRARAWVIEDDYDSEFRYGTHPVPCLHGLDTDGRVIYVGSFSKTLFPAMRLGFLIVPRDLREMMATRAPRERYSSGRARSGGARRFHGGRALRASSAADARPNIARGWMRSRTLRRATATGCCGCVR